MTVAQKVAVPCRICGDTAEIPLEPGIGINPEATRTCAICARLKPDKLGRTRKLPVRPTLHFDCQPKKPVPLKGMTDTSDFSFSQECGKFDVRFGFSRMAKMGILDCPEFVGCFERREELAMKLWAKDLKVAEILSELAAEGYPIVRDTLYRDINSALKKLRARIRTLGPGQLSLDLKWILGISGDQGYGLSGDLSWELIWHEQIQERADALEVLQNTTHQLADSEVESNE